MNFRACSCGYEWRSRDNFMSDPQVEVIGYQVNFEHLQEGFFLFNHLTEGCKTTLAVPAGCFFDLHKGTVFKGHPTPAKECSGYCLRRENIAPCPIMCECAFVRDILQTVSKWPKRSAA